MVERERPSLSLSLSLSLPLPLLLFHGNVNCACQMKKKSEKKVAAGFEKRFERDAGRRMENLDTAEGGVECDCKGVQWS